MVASVIISCLVLTRYSEYRGATLPRAVVACLRAGRWTDVLPSTSAAWSCAVSSRLPRALLLLLGIEALERFAAGGLAALAVFFLTERRGFSAEQALDWSATFYALTYLATVGGGLLADKMLGLRLGLLVGAAALFLGYGLAAFDREAWLVGAGFMLIAGQGLFKAAISTSIGRVSAQSSGEQRAAYRLFYFAVNVGLALGPVGGALVLRRFGWRPALMLLVGALGLVLIGLVLGHGELREVEPVPAAAPGQDAPAANPSRRLHVLGLVLVGLVIHGIGYFQSGGTLLLFARDATERTVGGYTLSASLFAALPAVLTLVFTPLLTWVEGRRKHEGPVRAWQYLTVGAVVTALGFLLLIAADVGRGSGRANPLWLMGTLALLTLGEVFVMPASMELVAVLAPARYKALSLALWYVAMAIGQWLSGKFGAWWTAWPHYDFFALMVLVSLLAGAGFLATNAWAPSRVGKGTTLGEAEKA